ncbi:methyltransferase domain-containing protein [Crepidotus variabilis]|uniref:Methyltransferase domain-containing protein n=1 Tax=Crepidotus variabilis TaxID=179855 RepID=A0A9P6E8L2_9AGAR|nr:methyltransferase domain-containing protein [Crepidotus variabilis]
MSPKKAHEVARMATYVVRLVAENRIPVDQLRLVDVGAGQGYLTRALKFYLPQSSILALDADEAQTTGAKKWEDRVLPNVSPPIFHKTTLITPQNLVAVIDEWIYEDRPAHVSPEPSPVILVALHACGSLTTDVVRAYFASKSRSSSHRGWVASGVVAVGCCYNLMYPNDFPLSTVQKQAQPTIDLPTSAFHLAAQVPSEWLSSISPPIPGPLVELSIKKVVYRALMGRLLEEMPPLEVKQNQDTSTTSKSATVPARWTRRPETWTDESSNDLSTASRTEQSSTSSTGQTPTLVKLGKLNNQCYASWTTFLEAVERKLLVKFPDAAFDEQTKGVLQGDLGHESLDRKLEVLHTLRCLIGPVIESAILRDRVQWIKETLAATQETREVNETSPEVGLVNLFDQSTGSGRNVAIVVAPKIPTNFC